MIGIGLDEMSQKLRKYKLKCRQCGNIYYVIEHLKKNTFSTCVRYSSIFEEDPYNNCPHDIYDILDFGEEKKCPQ